MSVVIEQNISQDGIMYFLRRARAMSTDDGIAALNYDIFADSVFREAWLAALCISRDKMQGNPITAWDHIEIRCSCAVVCYMLETSNVSRRMNRFCREALPVAASWDAFPYKGLWFFLLLAFETLPPFDEQKVFRGVAVLSKMPNNNVPAVQFLSASLHVDEAERFALPEGLLLTIKGVFMYYIRDVSFYATEPGKKNVLIWPFVTFTAGDVQDGRLELVWLDCMPRECEPRCINECHPH